MREGESERKRKGKRESPAARSELAFRFRPRTATADCPGYNASSSLYGEGEHLSLSAWRGTSESVLHRMVEEPCSALSVSYGTELHGAPLSTGPRSR